MISVIIPIYNAQAYLHECLESLETQTYLNFEIILVDDGSNDDSGQICDSFAQNRNNCKVIHTSNHGLLLARRRGILISSGEYVLCLDSDDCLRQDTIQHVTNIIDTYHPDLICYNQSRGQQKTYKGIQIAPGLKKSGLYEESSLDKIKEAICLGLFNSMNKVIKKNVIDLDFDYSAFAGLMHGEDWLQIIAIGDRLKSVYYLDEVLYFYRESPQSSTYTFKPKQIDDLDQVFKRLNNYSTLWGEKFESLGHQGICKHCFWLIQGVSKTDNWKEKVNTIIAISQLMKKYCGNDLKDAIQKTRFDFRLVLYLAIHNKPICAMKLAQIEHSLYRRIHSEPE